MVRVKICGVTNATDAKMAARLGADAVGFNFAPVPRGITKERARAIIAAMPPFVTPVGLFVNQDLDLIHEICDFTGITTVQLHGDERPSYAAQLSRYKVIKAFRIATERDLRMLARYDVDAYLLDARVRGKYGGTGKTFPWHLARAARSHGPVIIAGGLNPQNVAQAIQQAQPYGVDVSSGVERALGRKDRRLTAKFIAAAKAGT